MSHKLKPPLSNEEETRLFKKFNNENDLSSRNTLIEHNLRLVKFICSRYVDTGIESDDLFSIGTIGLIKSVDKFDISKKLRFSTFAGPCIENEILIYLRSYNKQKHWEISLYSPIKKQLSDYSQFSEQLKLIDIISEDQKLVDVETHLLMQSLKRVIKYLDDTEKLIIKHLYYKNTSQEELSRRLKMSQSMISRKKSQLLNKLRLLLNTC